MKKIAMIVIAAAMLAACNSEQEETNGGEVTTTENRELTKEERKAKVVERIQFLENELKDDHNFEQRSKLVEAEELVRFYRDYANINPSDSIAATYLFKAADLSIGLKKYDQAIGFMDNILKNQPNFERRVEVMLLKGFVYEVHLNQYAEAVKAYKELISSFPNHRLAMEAQASIDNMTLTEEQLIAKLRKNALNTK